MERRQGRIREWATSERGLILEALAAIYLLYWLLGFEVTVLSTLSVMSGHLFKLSWKNG